MNVVIPVREALGKGIWDRLCDLKGLSGEERRRDRNDTELLTLDEARILGLLPED